VYRAVVEISWWPKSAATCTRSAPASRKSLVAKVCLSAWGWTFSKPARRAAPATMRQTPAGVKGPRRPTKRASAGTRGRTESHSERALLASAFNWLFNSRALERWFFRLMRRLADAAVRSELTGEAAGELVKIPAGPIRVGVGEAGLPQGYRALLVDGLPGSSTGRPSPASLLPEPGMNSRG